MLVALVIPTHDGVWLPVGQLTPREKVNLFREKYLLNVLNKCSVFFLWKVFYNAQLNKQTTAYQVRSPHTVTNYNFSNLLHAKPFKTQNFVTPSLNFYSRSTTSILVQLNRLHCGAHTSSTTSVCHHLISIICTNRKALAASSLTRIASAGQKIGEVGRTVLISVETFSQQGIISQQIPEVNDRCATEGYSVFLPDAGFLEFPRF